jgi:hypothetical protein
MARNGATQALFFVDVAWKIWKERADDVSLPGNAFSWASLRMLDIVSTSNFLWEKKGGGAPERDGTKRAQLLQWESPRNWGLYK